jgi:pimeloyl-ACP methyl ester carboxylesterase
MTVITTDHWVNTARGKLFARRWMPLNAFDGAQETILLFHDSIGCVDLWRDFPSQLSLATRRPVVAYDRLGFGKSNAHEEALPLSFIADEASSTVPESCASLQLKRVIPFGHSVGGALAIATAARMPEKVASVVTESAQSFVEDQTVRGVRAARERFERPVQVDRLARYHGAKARWALNAWIDTWLAPAFSPWSLDEDLRAVRFPVLALHGDQDEFGSVEQAERIVRLSASSSKAVILESCGHVPHREQPARVLCEVKQFLDKHYAVLLE